VLARGWREPHSRRPVGIQSCGENGICDEVAASGSTVSSELTYFWLVWKPQYPHAAVSSSCWNTSNMSVITWAKHRDELPASCVLDGSLLSVDNQATSVKNMVPNKTSNASGKKVSHSKPNQTHPACVRLMPNRYRPGTRMLTSLNNKKYSRGPCWFRDTWGLVTGEPRSSGCAIGEFVRIGTACSVNG